MTENTKIEWCHHTFNPWIGCTKVSDGCKNCYAEAMMDKRYGKAKWGPRGERVRTSEANWGKPFAWNRKAEREGRRYRVFCASLADVFEDNEQIDDWRLDLFEHVIARTPNLDWLILTKRPQVARRFFSQRKGLLFDNVWIGTSVEDQKTADMRIPHLLRIPAKVRFLSCEPLLEELDISPFLDPAGCACCGSECCRCLDKWPWDPGRNQYAEIHWVITGGESGLGARPMGNGWVQSIRDQCIGVDAPFFFKQWGEYLSTEQMTEEFYAAHITPAMEPISDDTDGGWLYRVGKKKAGRMLDGVEWNQFPGVTK